MVAITFLLAQSFKHYEKKCTQRSRCHYPAHIPQEATERHATSLRQDFEDWGVVCQTVDDMRHRPSAAQQQNTNLHTGTVSVLGILK